MLEGIFYRSYLNPGEKILYVAHIHPITIYSEFIKNAFWGFLLPYLFYTLMPPLWYLWAVWAVFGIAKMVLMLLDWYYDCFLITNQSVIDIQWEGVFTRSSTRIEYHTIEGISYEVNGFFATILNYGNITIERIGSGTVVALEKVITPKNAEREILNAQNEFLRNKSFRDHKTLKDLLTNMMQDYSNFN